MILRKITACVSYCITKVFRFFYFDGNFVLFVAILSSKTLETRRKYFRIEDRNKINLPWQERERERLRKTEVRKKASDKGSFTILEFYRNGQNDQSIIFVWTRNSIFCGDLKIEIK